MKKCFTNTYLSPAAHCGQRAKRKRERCWLFGAVREPRVALLHSECKKSAQPKPRRPAFAQKEPFPGELVHSRGSKSCIYPNIKTHKKSSCRFCTVAYGVTGVIPPPCPPWHYVNEPKRLLSEQKERRRVGGRKSVPVSARFLCEASSRRAGKEREARGRPRCRPGRGAGRGKVPG